MTRVRWTDNVCTVGGTCIHGIFTGSDLVKLWELCPEGTATPTFYHERLPAYGYGRRELLERLKTLDIYDTSYGYYFTFMEKDGNALLTFLKEFFPMKRGESCY